MFGVVRMSVCDSVYPVTVGWWFVAKGLEEGWVPCSYLEPLKVGQEDDTISSLGESTAPKLLFICLLSISAPFF